VPRHWTLPSEFGVLDPARVEHRTHSESIRWLASGVREFATLSVFKSGEHRMLRGASGGSRPVTL